MAHALIRLEEAAEDSDDAPVGAGPSACDAADAPLFENAEWAVTVAGLEHKGNGYCIEREDLGRRRPDGLWAWPLHMLEKAWCSPRAFAEAFLRAAHVHGVAPDGGLEASFLAAARARAEWGVWDRMVRELGLRGSAPEPVGLGALAHAGAEVCRRSAFGRAVGAGTGDETKERAWRRG